MKKLVLFFGLLTVISVAQSFSPTQDKQITVSMSLPEWQVIYSAVDNAPLAGEVRKPLLQKILSQVQAQTQPAQKQDSTTSKSKKP